MKSFAFLAFLAAIAVADESDFPSDDAFHADCHMVAIFPHGACDHVYEAMDTLIRSWNTPETSPAQGVYSIYEQKKDYYIWSTRVTKNGMYTDDQMFSFVE